MLNFADALHHPPQAFQRMFLRHVIAMVIGAIHMGIPVGIAHGDVDHRNMEFLLQLANKPNGFAHIRRQAAFLNTEAIGIREAIVGIQSAGEEEARRIHRRRCCTIGIL